MRLRPFALVLGALVMGGSSQATVERPAPTRVQVADGVFLFRTAPYGDVGLDGNSVVIVSRDGVLVFDTNGTPSAAAAVLEEIRRITPQPVRFIVYSHWHWDHWYGTEVYLRAFPGAQVIAQERGRAMMAGPAIEFNRPGLETQLPAYLKGLEQRVAKAEAAIPPSPDLPRLKQTLDEDRFFLEQKLEVRPVLPNITFSDRLTLHLGDREIQVWHLERAVTPGDTFLYLPREKILVTGDLLVNPISFALSCYPSGWLRTLEAMDAMDVSAIIPGHGVPLGDKRLLRATIGVFRALIEKGAELKARGLDPDAAKAEILPGLHDLMIQITGDAPEVNNAFSTQLVDWYLHRVYDELNGPLDDAIAPIPRR